MAHQEWQPPYWPDSVARSVANYKIAILSAIICIMHAAVLYGAEQNHLSINCTFHSPYEKFFFRLVEEICSLNNLTITHNTPPVGRSLIHVNQGIDDGDGPRIAGLSTTYPNLVRVTEPFGAFVFGAFVKHPTVKIDGWPSLAHLNLAYIHGWKIFDNNVTAAQSITKVKNKTLLFNLLNSGRTDAALLTKLSGYATVKELGLQGIRFVEPPLAVAPNFLYLNKKHTPLVPALALSLKKLKHNGRYAQLYQEMISPHLPE